MPRDPKDREIMLAKLRKLRNHSNDRVADGGSPFPSRSEQIQSVLNQQMIDMGQPIQERKEGRKPPSSPKKTENRP